MTMSNENPRFAVELRSACTRIRQMVVPHLYFRQAEQRLLEALDTSNLVLLVGPSAVGKGTLIRAVIEKFNAPVERNPKAIRAIVVRGTEPAGFQVSLEGVLDCMSRCNGRSVARAQGEPWILVQAILTPSIP